MTNETREALVLLKAALAACEEAVQRFAALKENLQQSGSGRGVAEVSTQAEHSLAAVRTLARQQSAFLEQAQAGSLAEVIAREPNLKERFAVERVLRAVGVRQDALRSEVRSSAELLDASAAFISYQLNVISGTAAEDTYGSSQPIAGPATGVRREIAMFDADV